MLLPPDAFMFNFRFVCSSIIFSLFKNTKLNATFFWWIFSQIQNANYDLFAFRFGFEWKIIVFPRWTATLTANAVNVFRLRLEFMIYGHWHITSSTKLPLVFASLNHFPVSSFQKKMQKYSHGNNEHERNRDRKISNRKWHGNRFWNSNPKFQMCYYDEIWFSNWQTNRISNLHFRILNFRNNKIQFCGLLTANSLA